MDIDKIEKLENELLELEQLYRETLMLAKADKTISKEEKLDLKNLKILFKKCRKGLLLEKKKAKQKGKKKSTEEKNDINPILTNKLSELDQLLEKLRNLKHLST
jgi:hypothetical protein